MVDLDQIVARVVAKQKSRPARSSFDLDAVIARVVDRGAPHPTFDQLLAGPWPPPLLSRYFVQADADVATLRLLRPQLAGRNVGVSTNADALDAQPRMRALVDTWLRAGSPVYVDSGVYPRWRRGDSAPEWRRVFDVYQAVLERAPDPDLVAVTAPDVIGNARATEALQRRWSKRIRSLIDAGARVVVPVQGRTAGVLVRSFSLAPYGAWVGVPVREKTTTPLPVLIEALLSAAGGVYGGSGTYARPHVRQLPRLHMLGLGGSQRLEDYALRLSLVYRIIAGPHLFRLLTERAGRGGSVRAQRAVAEWLGGELGNEQRRRELLQLVGCVQPDGTFPCPPGARDTYGDSHPTVDAAMRDVWEQAGLAALPTPALLAHPLAQEGIIEAGSDAMTRRIAGRDDVSVYWWPLVERQSDWTELCRDALDEAHQVDPCMIPDSWGVSDVEELLGTGGLDRIETDAITVSIAAANKRWIQLGQQRRATPRWWQDKPKRYRFTWNLLTTLWDRWQREQRSRYRLPDGYTDEGFIVKTRAVGQVWPAGWRPSR